MKKRQIAALPTFFLLRCLMEICYKDLYSHLKKLDKSFRDIESTQRKYGKTTKRLMNQHKYADLDDKNSRHLYDLYHDFCDSLSRGEKIIELSLERLDRVIESRDGPPDGIKPTKHNKRKSEEKSGPPKKKQKRSSASSTPGQTPVDTSIPIGHRVAAQIRPDEWILAVVKGYSLETNTYTIKDADEEETAVYTLNEDAIIPTSCTKRKGSAFEVNYDLPKDSAVLAVFPETTCFYKATVVSSTRRNKKITEYTLLFEDDEDERGIVPKRKLSAKLVVPLR
uniref:SGF29 C-terminal domain-containing protein n=1 Tax=Vannella robusta TaxID=1487602 RepID=A0A7S4HN43_9EUKA|mmetsp:Transcript_1305/g.1683  ORF Transcript_1305/g.1683 Transcript_1305/m.1683 type:complete len:281 (+) Transcript_1305:286-1128(+)